MPDSGALCPACRHEAAEAHRRARSARDQVRQLIAQEEEQERIQEERRLLEWAKATGAS